MGGSLKINALLELVQRAGKKLKDFNLFIETGTYQGDTIFECSSFFKKCYTIELKPEFFEQVVRKASVLNISNTTFVCGDSAKEIGTILNQELFSSVIFYLDAHWSSGNTARGSLDCPVLEELKLIFKHPGQHLIIIDDFRLFGTNNDQDWSNITISNALKILENRIATFFIKDDRLVILTN